MLEKERNITHIIYLLQALSFIFGITAVAAIILNYIKMEDVRGTWLDSHFRWQIRTFWFGLLWAVLGFFTVIIGIGFIILFIDGVWIIYRIVKGWLRLYENREMYEY